MQAVYFPKSILKLSKGDQLNVLSNHDEYSLWFDVNDDLNNNQPSQDEQDLGNTIVSRNRLAQINSTEANDMFTRLFKKYEDSEKSILIANDDLSVTPFIAAKMNFKQVRLQLFNFYNYCLNTGDYLIIERENNLGVCFGNESHEN